MTWRIARRELYAQLHGLPLWLLLAAIGGLAAWLMFAQLEVYQQIAPQLRAAQSALGINDLVITPTLNSVALMLLLAVPLLYMHALADERASGRLPLLLASVPGVMRLLLGKWLGNGAAALLLLLPGLAVPASLALGTAVEPGRLFAALLGLLLLTAMAGAICLAFSAYTRHAASALAASYGLLLFLWLLDSLSDSTGSWYRLALNPPLAQALGGRLDLGVAGYFLGFTAAALLLATLRLLHDRDPRPLRGLRGRLRLLALTLTLSGCLGLMLKITQQHPLPLFDNTPPPPQALLQALDALQGPLVATVYAPPQPLLRSDIEKQLQPLRRHYPAFELRYIDPLKQPQLMRELGIRRHGELTLEAMGRSQHIAEPTPGSLLRALSHLARQGQPWIVAFTGHGEASLRADGPGGLSAFAAAAAGLGFQAVELDPRQAPQLPDNAALLLVAAPAQPYPPAILERLHRYLEGGGRLLWLHEGEDTGALTALSGILAGDSRDGLRQVQPQDTHWPPRQPVERAALFDGGHALQAATHGSWQVAARLVDTNATGQPALGLALQQGDARLLAFGDSDFLRNSLIGRAGNAELGIAALNWLTDNALASAPPADDLALHWSDGLVIALTLLEMLLLPLALLATGWVIRRRRLTA